MSGKTTKKDTAPKRGGKRKGAGRPRKHDSLVTQRTLSLPETSWEKVDAMRGDLTESEWLRLLLLDEPLYIIAYAPPKDGKSWESVVCTDMETGLDSLILFTGDLPNPASCGYRARPFWSELAAQAWINQEKRDGSEWDYRTWSPAK